MHLVSGSIGVDSNAQNVVLNAWNDLGPTSKVDSNQMLYWNDSNHLHYCAKFPDVTDAH